MAERVPPAPLPTASPSCGSAMRAARSRSRPRDSFRASRRSIAAVTGTSGKTSVAAFTRQIWAALGEQAASIGTIGLVSPDARGLRLAHHARSGRAAPLARRARRRRRHASRDGGLLARARPAPARRRARRGRRLHQSQPRPSRLSSDARRPISPPSCGCSRTWSQPRGAAVIDADHEHADAVVAAAKQRRLRLLTVGRRGEGIRLVDIDDRRLRADAHGSSMRGNDYTVRLPLVGAFQVENALVAAGLAIATGSEPAAVFAALAQAQGRQGPARAGRREQRRADLRRLCPQARRARQGARGAAALCRAAGSSWCSAAAATATRASGR